MGSGAVKARKRDNWYCFGRRRSSLSKV